MLPKFLAIAVLAVSMQTSVAQIVIPCGPQYSDSTSDIRDCLYNYQWHLNNTGQNVGADVLVNPRESGGTPGEDINVEQVWRKYKGNGSYVAILDAGIQFDHPDLIDNISTQHSIDFYPNVATSSSHGTNVAGIIAARDNLIGIRGVAPRAKIYGLNILDRPRLFVQNRHILNALTHQSATTSVSNSSWGYRSPFSPPAIVDRLTRQQAIETGISRGYYGKGTVYVFAAGNNHCLMQYVATPQSVHRVPNPDNSYPTGRYNRFCSTNNANYDAIVNYHAVVAVCAVNNRGRHNGRSEFGANLWVCAPSRDRVYADTIVPISNGQDKVLTYVTGVPVDRNGIFTTTTGPTTNNGLYNFRFGGTSAATPMVSGVVALMREANPNLGWRDVKLILANSARKNDAADNGWATGATKYGAFANDADGKYHFNHKYGFGVVNAQKAVELAEQWINLPPREPNTEMQTKNVTISSGLGNTAVTSNLTIQSDINFTEYLDVYVDIAKFRFHDLSIKLTSPSGAVSELAIPSDKPVPSSIAYQQNKFINVGWRYGTARHLGEDPNGTWKLRYENKRGSIGTLKEWRIRVRGYRIKMDAIAAEDLSESNVGNNPLTLTLRGAQWKSDLQTSNFILRNAPVGLSVREVSRTSDTQIRLNLTLNKDFDDNRQFQVVATTPTVSNYAQPLVSNDIKITADVVPTPVSAPSGELNSEYNYTIVLDDIFGMSDNPASYLISGLEGSGLTANITKINGVNMLKISGVPTISRNHRVYITATTSANNQITTFFDIRILPPIEVYIKFFPERTLK